MSTRAGSIVEVENSRGFGVSGECPEPSGPTIRLSSNTAKAQLCAASIEYPNASEALAKDRLAVGATPNPKNTGLPHRLAIREAVSKVVSFSVTSSSTPRVMNRPNLPPSSGTTEMPSGPAHSNSAFRRLALDVGLSDRALSLPAAAVPC